MRFDPTRKPMDMPPPASPDDVQARFGLRLFGLVPQPAVDELGVGTVSSTQTLRGQQPGEPVLQSASITYTLWRNPDDRSDPANLLELTNEMRRSLAVEPVAPLPDWMLRRRELMLYPALWECVQTLPVASQSVPVTASSALVHHANHILTNTFRELRVRGGFPGELDDRVSEAHLEQGVGVTVDGREVSGVRLDTDPHVFGLAAEVDDRMLVAVVARDHLPFLRFEFASR